MRVSQKGVKQITMSELTANKKSIYISITDKRNEKQQRKKTHTRDNKMYCLYVLLSIIMNVFMFIIMSCLCFITRGAF